MLNIYICEDNDNERDYLSQLIKNIILIEDYDLNFACATADPYELLNIISTDNNTGEYSRAVTPQIRQAGNRLSGLAETAYASLLA